MPVHHIENQGIPYTLSALFFVALLFPMSMNSRILGYIIVLAAYLLVLLYAFSTETVVLRTSRWAILFIGVIAVIASYHLAVNPSAEKFVRTPLFIGIAVINVMVLPGLISERVFYTLLARLSASIVCIGFISLLGGPSTIAGIDIGPMHAPFSVVGVKIQPMASIFTNPNTLGFLSLIGVISAAAEFRLHQTRISLGLINISGLGLLLSYYQTGWLALTAVVLLYLAYRARGKAGVLTTTLFGGTLVIVLFSVVFSLLPGPDSLQMHQMSGRRELWLAGATVFQHQPFLGYGFGESVGLIQPYLTEMHGLGLHNSFLRLFIETGLVGGGAYLAFHLLGILQTVRSISTEQSMFLFVLVVAFTIIQIFNSLTLFGLSIQSVLISLGFGYALSACSGVET